jgi:hypothetical protein
MLSLNDPIDFNTAFQSLLGEFLDLNVHFIHAWVTDVGFGLADTTDETDHRCTTVIPAQSLVERALDKSRFKGVNLEETLRKVQRKAMIRVPRENDSRVFELRLEKRGLRLSTMIICFV